MVNRLWYGTLAVLVAFGMGGCEPQGYELKRIQYFTVEGELVTDEEYESNPRHNNAYQMTMIGHRPSGLTCIVSYRD